MTYRLGVDVGGTFTDLLLIDDDTGATFRAKTPSTPDDPSQGVLTGIGKVTADVDVAAGDLSHVMHGTTVATNAVLEGKGATVGLLVTRGYRQVLHIARSYVPGGLAGWIIWNKPAPLAALEHTQEVDGRIDARGEEIVPLDEQSVHDALTGLAHRGIEALTISFINSFADPSHERRAAEIARELLGDIPISLSSEILPEIREYERTLTTVANAYVPPAGLALHRQPREGADRSRRDGAAAHPALRRGADVHRGGEQRAGQHVDERSGRWRRRCAVDRATGRLRQPADPGHGRHVD